MIAEIDSAGLILNISRGTVARNSFELTTPRNGTEARKGGRYDSEQDRFIPPQPYPSWVLSEGGEWEPPVRQPSPMTKWHEPTQRWHGYGERYAHAQKIHALRQKRNRLLAESDWTGASDTALTSEQQSAWRLYRQHLRYLPSTAVPTLGDNGQLAGVTWPMKP